MPKVLVATVKPFAAEAVSRIKNVFDQAGYEMVLLEKYGDQAEFIEAAKDVEAIIVRSDIADREVIENAKKLKIIVRAGAGYDNVDLEAASQKGLVVMNTPGQNANAVAELALGMMVYQARGHFNGKSGRELKDKKLGLLAYGNVGKCVAAIARGFGMEIFAFDPFVPKKIIEKDKLKSLDRMEELFSTCNYVSVHIPLNEQTKNSINWVLLSKMPENATLVNTARKEVICEEDLLKMFAERPDFEYVSDIEPDCKAEIAEKYPGRFYFTPKKMGAQTAEANINAGIAAANQIVDFFEKGNRTFQVNK